MEEEDDPQELPPQRPRWQSERNQFSEVLTVRYAEPSAGAWWNSDESTVVPKLTAFG
jgi:hypothetical protein